MSDYDILNYRIYCNVENDYVLPILQFRSQPAPTLCPNDHANRTNIQDVTIVGVIAQNNVTVNEPTTGIFEAKMWKFALPMSAPGTVTTNIITLPNNIQVWQTGVEMIPQAIGDQLSVCVAPLTPIGTLTAPVSSGNVINVPQATVQNINVNVGCVITLYDSVGMQTQELGNLVAIDKNAYTFTVQNAVALSFPAGTVVQMSNYLVRDYEFAQVGYRTFGNKGLRSRWIPANVPIQISWKNSTGDAKTLYLDAEFYKS